MFDGSPTATSALLTAPQPVSPGVYRISIVVTDSEGRRCEAPESLTLEVCQCDYRDICQRPHPPTTTNPIIGEGSGRMGAAAIGLLFLGLLLLLCEYVDGSKSVFQFIVSSSQIQTNFTGFIYHGWNVI